MIALVDDVVRINGAISRLEKEGDSCELELSYSADDLLGPEAFDLKAFLENVCMEPAKIKLKIENGELKCL